MFYMSATNWPDAGNWLTAHEFLFRITCGISHQVAVPKSHWKWDVICRRKGSFVFKRTCPSQKRRLKNGKKHVRISLKKDFSLWQNLSLIGTYKNINIFSKEKHKACHQSRISSYFIQTAFFLQWHCMVRSIAFTGSYHMPSMFEELYAK